MACRQPNFCLPPRAILGRAAGFFDALLADRFTRHVSVEVIKHASQLDLASYEDPVFYDKLERARVQATDRIAMIHAIGQLIQQFIIAASLSASIFWFSPWLLLLLIVAVVPAFLGESHFAFLGYSLNIRQTPVRRQLDYLRVLGASKESAKELKLFGLGDFITGEYARLANDLYDQNVALARRRLWAGTILSLLSTAGYYGAFAYVVYRTVTGDLSWGTLQFLAGAIGGASNNIQTIFSTFSSIADQSLFLDGSGRVLRGPADRPLQARCRSGASADSGRLRFRSGVIFLSGQPPPYSRQSESDGSNRVNGSR